MKIQRIFTLDLDIATELAKENNQSFLVNELLKAHFEKIKISHMTREQILEQIKKTKAELEEKLKTYTELEQMGDKNER